EYDKLRRMRTGVTYNPAVIQTNVEAMESLALKKGLNFITVEPRVTRNDRDGTVDVVFAIVKGQRAFVERIDIEGNTTTLDSVIRRQFRTVEGDPLNPREIAQAAERIRALGFFSDVQVSQAPGNAPDQDVVKVNVTEAPTGSLTLGATYGLKNGFGITVGFSESNFLGRGQGLTVNIQTGTSSLDSRIEFSRTRRSEFISARFIRFQTFRDTEDDETIPSLVADLTYDRRFIPDLVGGEGGLWLQTHTRDRKSSNPFDGPDVDSVADGRDATRFSARIDWRRAFLLPFGVEATIMGEASADAYKVTRDAVFSGETTRTHGSGGVELRWPLIKAAASGATQVIEPVVQLIWSPSGSDALLNEDSVLVEFDEGSLFSLDRFPGSDAV
ncbi:MAG: hypothetical protein B7Y02_18115, partial [Rhodobacterales bacterium 17-64-5]